MHDYKKRRKYFPSYTNYDHYFDSGLALDHGVMAAILYHHLEVCIEGNFMNKVNLDEEGHALTILSYEYIASTIRYLSPSQVKASIATLMKAGMIVEKLRIGPQGAHKWIGLPDYYWQEQEEEEEKKVKTKIVKKR